MRVVHVITGLNAGGAEEMLFRLLAVEREAPRTVRVVSLTDVGPVGERIRALGLPVDGLGLHPGRPAPGALVRLVQLLRRDRPDLVQTWMYHADLLGGVAAWLLGIPVIWGVHHQWRAEDKLLTRLTRKACAALSHLVPERVVFASESSLRAHAAAGYARRVLVHVPNGFDLGRFRPDPTARAEVRRELGLPESAPVVGHAARYHPDKDHATFVAAAAIVSRTLGAARFVLCGDGVTWENAELANLLRRAGLVDVVHLLGQRPDVERVLAAVDVACLSSRTESFPLAAAEAMACGVPCVSTECGDVRAILGGTGGLVPAGDAPALAEALLAQLALPPEARAAMGARAREHVARSYGLEAVAARYHQVQDEAVRTRTARAGTGGGRGPRRPGLRAARKAEVANAEYFRHLEAGSCRRLLEAFQVPLAGQRVLDLGCGPGHYLAEAALHAPTTLVGADASAASLAYAARELRRRGVANVALVRADGTRLPFRTGSLDVVLCLLTMPYLADDEAAVAEMARVLRPGGTLLFSGHDLGFPLGYLSRLRVKPLLIYPLTLLYLLTGKKLVRNTLQLHARTAGQLERAGITVVRLTPRSGVLGLPATFVLKGVRRQAGA